MRTKNNHILPRLLLLVTLALLLGVYDEAIAQDATRITPRHTIDEPPSTYPLGLYIMDSETNDPYNWIMDAGTILGLKPREANFRHAQMIIHQSAGRMAIRAKNATTDQWLGWNQVAMQAWVDDNFVKIENGKVGIGTTAPTATLTVNGTAKAREIIVEENVGADFVFEKDYDLPALSELEAFLKANKHLPDIPSAEAMIRDGVKVGELQMKLLQKIEELTLYAIEQENTIKQMGNNQRKLQDQNERLVETIEELMQENRQLRHRLETIEEKLNVSSN